MMRRIIISLFLCVNVLTTTTMIAPAVVQAAPRANCSTEGGGFLDFPTWYKFLEPDGSSGECKLKFMDQNNDGLTDDNALVNSIPRILLAVFEIILRIAGLAAVGFVIYGGIQYILSQGEPEHTKGAKNTILNALIGLVVTMMSTAIVNLIGNGIS